VAAIASSAAATAGAAAVLSTPAGHAAPARALAVGGSVAEVVVAAVMERRLGEVGEPYRRGRAGVYGWLGKGALGFGAAFIAARGRGDRRAALVGGGLVLAGSLLERFAIFRAGFQSAADPKYTVGPQRARAAARLTDSPG
jgi:hypothetical protein